ncbi:HU family DNA-binding protein [Alicyclobacillus tolerans]|uniref:HU family DNA-binding protein n=1 Tax=Alicyclobacillus tolerans TaxID=90970 RepID=UPI001F1E77F5|nr:HU family DNA-binding protein [Alicyclobacillus tolerans]MCF8564992.1 HU family DNA-binding protein [Alicyclobacillus tolerans]
MNKSELIKSIATSANVSPSVVSKMFTAMQESIQNALTHGEKVSVRGFGTFAISDRAARRFYHPVKQESMMAPACRAVRFTPSAQIKEQLN